MRQFRIQFISTFLRISCILIFTMTSCQFKKANELPNIIVFLVDDMGLMDTSVPFILDSKGNPIEYPLNEVYRTPNMEFLAKQGVRFSNFYAHSVCSPSRTTILTGQNSARHRTTNWVNAESNNKNTFGPTLWNWQGLTKQSITVPKLLQQKGYKTIQIGKAHFGPIGSDGEDPLNIGFDISIAGSAIGHPGSYYGLDGYGNINGQKERAVPGLDKYHGKEIFLTEALTLEARAAISQAKKEGKPFFLYLSHYAVHAPFQSDSRFASHYENLDLNDKAKAYATLVEGIDKSLGDIIKHVKDLDLGENTLLLFLGDNGSDAPLPIINNYSSSDPLKGKKGNHWEGGMRVPLIASWVSPDSHSYAQRATPIAENTIQQQMGTIEDLFKTINLIANSKAPVDYLDDGFELQTQFKGEENKNRSELFLNHFPHAHRSNYFTSLVYDDWKLIYHYPVNSAVSYELYFLKEDPFEAVNLASSNKEQLKLMMQHLALQLQDKNALFPVKDGKPLDLIFPE